MFLQKEGKRDHLVNNQNQNFMNNLFTIKLIQSEKYNLKAKKIIEENFKKNEKLSNLLEKVLKEKFEEKDLPQESKRKIFFYEIFGLGESFTIFCFFDKGITLGGGLDKNQNPVELSQLEEKMLTRFLQ